MSATIIVEDNQSKVQVILHRYPELEKENIIIVRSESAAEMMMNMPIGKFVLFMDYELAPGCGDGKRILDYAIAKHCHNILHVVITTQSDEMAKEMQRMCTNAMVKCFHFRT